MSNKTVQPALEVESSPGEKDVSRARERRREAETAQDKTERDIGAGPQTIWSDLLAKAELGNHNARISESEAVELDRAAAGLLMEAQAEVKSSEGYSDVIRAGANKFALDTLRNAQVRWSTAVENRDNIKMDVDAQSKTVRENASAELAQAEDYRERAVADSAGEALAMVDQAYVDATQLTQRLRAETQLVCDEMIEEANIICATVTGELEARRSAIEDYQRRFESHIPTTDLNCNSAPQR